MAKKKRKYNPNLIKARHSYSFAEISEIYQIHRRTVQAWRKNGLRVIDEDSKPYLVIGSELKRFISEREQKRKHPLKPGEFYCPRCQRPRKSLQNRVSVEIKERMLGKKYRQALIRGICEVCKCRLFLFTSDRIVQELQERGVFLAKHKATLYSSADSSLNTDITRGEKC